MVFPTHDAPLEAVARNAARLAAYQLPGSGWDVLEPLQQQAPPVRGGRGRGHRRAADVRGRQRGRGARRGGEAAPTPPSSSRAIRSRSSGASAGPCIVCGTPEELVEAWRSAADCEPLLQEVIPGDDATLWTVGSYTDAAGTALGLFCGRKLVQMPRGFGTCRVGEARWREDAVEQALALLRRARLPRHRADRVPARSARRALQADGGEPAALAVARPGARLRRRPAAHRLPRRARPAAAAGALRARARRPPLGGRRGAPARIAAGGHAAAPRAARDRPRPGRGHVRLRDPLPAIVQASGLVTAPIARALRRRRRGAGRDHAAALARPPAARDARRDDLAQAALGARGGRRHARGRPRDRLRRPLRRRPLPPPRLRACIASRSALLLAMARARGRLPGRLLRAPEPASSSRSTPRA